MANGRRKRRYKRKTVGRHKTKEKPTVRVSIKKTGEAHESVRHMHGVPKKTAKTRTKLSIERGKKKKTKSTPKRGIRRSGAYKTATREQKRAMRKARPKAKAKATTTKGARLGRKMKTGLTSPPHATKKDVKKTMGKKNKY